MKQRGFTLVEIILTLVVMSILVLAISGFLELGSRGYVDTVERQSVQTQAQFVVEKLSRELRHAVPNSVEYDGNSGCLSFYPIAYFGFYHRQPNGDLALLVAQSVVDLTAISHYQMAINPTSVQEVQQAPQLATHLSSLADHTQLEDTKNTYLWLQGASLFASDSPSHRFYWYQSKISYCYEKPNLWRKVDNQVSVQVAGQLHSLDFQVQGASMEHNGLVRIALSFERQAEISRYEQEVQVLNVP